MTESTAGAPQPHVLEIFDETPAGYACRVCGVLIPREGGYADIHWDWHEASNGA